MFRRCIARSAAVPLWNPLRRIPAVPAAAYVAIGGRWCSGAAHASEPTLEEELRAVAAQHHMAVTPCNGAFNVVRAGDAPCTITLRCAPGGLIVLEGPDRKGTRVPRELLEPALRCLAEPTSDPPGDWHATWSHAAMEVHRILVSVEEHATKLLRHPDCDRLNLQQLWDTRDNSFVATCLVALERDQPEHKFAASLEAFIDHRRSAQCPLDAELASLETALTGSAPSRERLFCRSVIASVDHGRWNNQDVDRLDCDKLWEFLPASEVPLPSAEWWAHWCHGDMQQCQPIGRSMPAHAVLASLLNNSDSPERLLFAERASRLFQVRAEGKLWEVDAVPSHLQAASEVFVAARDRASHVEQANFPEPGSRFTHLDQAEELRLVARSVAIEAVQHTGGRFLHLGIARRPPSEEVSSVKFDAVKERFLEKGRVARLRHGTQDMGVAAPGACPRTPALAAMVDSRVCGGVPLTIRQSDFEVTRRAAARSCWYSAGARAPLCTTVASDGQGKTVQLLLSLGLLVEAFGGAALYANIDQEATVARIIERHGLPATPEMAMFVALYHRACVAQVTTEATAVKLTALLRDTFVLQGIHYRVSTATSVARGLLGCRSQDPLFVAVDDVRLFADTFKRPGGASNPDEALKIACGCSSVRQKTFAFAGMSGCFGFDNVAELSGIRETCLMPLSPLVPLHSESLDSEFMELLPPIAKAVCCQRAEFEEPSPEVRSALGRVAALLTATAGHGRVLSHALLALSAVTDEDVDALKRRGTEQATQDAVKVVTDACAAAEQKVRRPESCELYECAKLQHPRLSSEESTGGVIESPANARCVLEHLTSPFRFPQLSSSHMKGDSRPVLRTYMNGAWELAAVSGQRQRFKVHPPPVALPAVLSRFLVDATAPNPTTAAEAPSQHHRLLALFDLVLELNSIVAAFAEGGSNDPPPHELQCCKLFELAFGRVATLLLMLPCPSRVGDDWLPDHMERCGRGQAHTLNALHGSILPPPENGTYSAVDLRTLSTARIHEQLRQATQFSTAAAPNDPKRLPQHLVSFPLDMRRTDLSLLPATDLGTLAAQISDHVTSGEFPGVLHFVPSHPNNAFCDFVHVVGRSGDRSVDVLLWNASAHYTKTDGCLLDVIGFAHAGQATAARAADMKKEKALRCARSQFAEVQADVSKLTVGWCRAAEVLTKAEAHRLPTEHVNDPDALSRVLRKLALGRLSRRAAYLQLPDLEAQLGVALSTKVRVVVISASLTPHLTSMQLPADCRALTVAELAAFCPALGLPLRAAATYNGQLWASEHKQE